MKQVVRLYPHAPTAHVKAEWSGVASMAIANNTPYSLLVREASQEIPSYDRYDYFIPPGQYATLPVFAHEYGLALDVGVSTTPSYTQPCIVTLLSADEAQPQFSASSYRQSQHFDFVLDDAAPSHKLVFDTRTARALYFSLYALADGFGTQYWLPGTGCVMLHPAQTPTSAGGSFDTASRIIMLPRPSPRIEHAAPLASQYTALTFQRLLESPYSITCALDVALLDSVPSLPPRHVSDYRFSERTLPGETSGQVLFEHVFAGLVEYIEIAVKPISPSATFDLVFNLHSGSPSQFSEIWRAPISSAEKVTIAFGGPNALPTRHSADFLGRDPATGAVAWRFHLHRYFDRYMRLMCDVISADSVDVHVAVHYIIDI